MPVRIYEIAQHLGIKSKTVLTKAHELGIQAKVAASSIDKITAEYLEEQLRSELGIAPPAEEEPPAKPEEEAAGESAQPQPPAAAEPEKPQAAPGSPAPPAEPAEALQASAVTASPEPPVAEAPSAAAPPPAAPPPETKEAEEKAPAAPPAKPEEETAGESAQPQPPPAVEAPEAPEKAKEPAPPPAETKPPAETETAAKPAESSAAKEEAPPAPSEAEAAEAPVVETPPPKPAEPPRPRIGAKVGQIDLSKLGFRPREPRSRSRRAAEKEKREKKRAERERRPEAKAAPFKSEKAKQPSLPPLPPIEKLTAGEVVLRPPITVRALAEGLGRKPFQVITDLMQMGFLFTVNQTIEDPEIARRVCAKYRKRLRLEKRDRAQSFAAAQAKMREKRRKQTDSAEDLRPRPPVITIMGHVDHGKTTLLDAIRKSNVVATEAGGITQHIGAYTIHFPHPEEPKRLEQITFIDTPGHAAFTAMRARGANITDLVILVVAADDGVMPQTLEALDHARAAGVPIVVAVNKCDSPKANPMRVRTQLQQHGLAPDEWGGDTVFVDISALTKKGIDELLSMILLQAALLDLKANPKRRAEGNVVESTVEKAGPTATVLVRNGTLRVGDAIVCGPYYGRVRALIDDSGKRIKEAGPSFAAKLLGLNGAPEAGTEFEAVESEKRAKEIAEARREEAAQSRRAGSRSPRTIYEMLRASGEEETKVLKVLIKADTYGTAEAVVDSLNKIKSEKVKVEVVSKGVGAVSENDVILASASNGLIIGFNTRVDPAAAEMAKKEGVEIKLYSIIYKLTEDVERLMSGLLEPTYQEVALGRAEVRRVFHLSKSGAVAGCLVTQGKIVKGKARLLRNGNTLYDGNILTLRHFQSDVNEVHTGLECGIRLEGFTDYQEGDLIESYKLEEVQQTI